MNYIKTPSLIRSLWSNSGTHYSVHKVMLSVKALRKLMNSAEMEKDIFAFYQRKHLFAFYLCKQPTDCDLFGILPGL